ncbi:AI-2E family transporter [Kocuria sp. M1R5S2]|uniref:AI-2E family transporter n=1 Tax=Kocuria rhizosphaerae TaxID=3376285 RepID=UPI00379960E9
MTRPRHRSVSHTRDLWSDVLGRAATRALQGLVLLAATVVVVYGLIQLKLVVIPLMISLILAAALNPVVAFLRRRGVPGALATWITFLAAIVVLGGVVTGVVFAVRNEWDELVVSAVGGLDRLREFVVAGPIPVGQQGLDDAVTAVRDYATSPGFGAGALLGISAATQVITGTVLVAVILYFFLQDGARIWAFFLHRFHGETLTKLLASGVTTLHVLGGYVRGTAVVALLEAVVIGVTLVVLRVPLALPLAVLIFLGGFVPIVGAALIGAVAALVALVANGPVVALVVVAVVVAINQLDGRVLQPMVLGRALSLHPLVVLLALAGGGILSGIVGAVLAVPLTAVGWALVQIWLPAPGGAGPAAGSAPPPAVPPPPAPRPAGRPTRT